jgi:hypothetical protein
MSPRALGTLGTLAALGALILATPALACPPPPPGYVMPTPAQIVRADYGSAQEVFEAEVTRTIQTREASRRPGALRVTRVYKGSLRVGQLLPIYFNELWTTCDRAPPELVALRGSHGLVLLSSWNMTPPRRFRGFEEEGFVEEFRRQRAVP